jgi:hypothetical protein
VDAVLYGERSLHGTVAVHQLTPSLLAVYFACTIGCIFCLIHRKIPGHIWFLPPTLLLFTLITAFVIVDIVLLFDTTQKKMFDLEVAASILTYLSK